MLRWLAFCILSGLVIFGSVWGMTKVFFKEDEVAVEKQGDKNAQDIVKAPAKPNTEATAPRVAGAQPFIVVKDARFVSTISREIPSERDGKLLVVGTELPPGEEAKIGPGTRVANVPMASLLVEINPSEKDKYPANDLVQKNGKLYRHYQSWENPAVLVPGKVEIEVVRKNFKELQDGDQVKAGQLVAVVNPSLTIDEMAIRIQKLVAAEAERQSAEMTAKEYQLKWESSKRLLPGGAATPEQVRMDKLGFDRYVQEEIAKKATIGQTQRELSGVVTQLGMHEIRPAVGGRVKKVYRHTGEPAKNLEPLLKIEDTDRLRVEGLIEIQNQRGIREGMKVVIEPHRPVNPTLYLRGHLQDINCLGVGMIVGGGTSAINVVVSGSKDRSVRFWDASSGVQYTSVSGIGPRSIATNPPGAARSLAAVGLEDGGVQLFDLKKNAEGKVEISKLALNPECHTRAITCMAFSPEGEILATGSEDLGIALWKVEKDGKLTSIARVKGAHRSTLTYLQFANKEDLVSAGRDNTLHVWSTVQGKLAQVTNEEFTGRSGEVTMPGVSPDGKTFLYDQGKELKIMSLADRHLVGSIVNITGSLPFTGPAFFSPDGRTIVTNCAGENRVELWRTPAGGRRATELRQFVWAGGQTTCAAFTPDSRFLVTGTSDHQVLVWEMPEGREIEEKDLTGTITYISNFIEGSDRQVQIWADLDMPNPGWLVPGGKVTMVIEPTRGANPGVGRKENQPESSTETVRGVPVSSR